MMERLVRALSESDNSERQGAVVVVPETADAALLNQPLRCLADVEAIERIPLDDRLGVVDISRRIALGLAARDAGDTAMDGVPLSQRPRPPPPPSMTDGKVTEGDIANLGKSTMKMMEELMEELIGFQERFGPGAKSRERRTAVLS